jgi:Fe-S cluster biogenesis protein NfuA/nitrite reductase/ring-hydroxylating ferredoxin subunit
MAQARNLREVGDRVETLLGELRNVAEPAVQRKAEEVVRILMEFYGAGIARMIELCADERVTSLAVAFSEDPLVSSLLSLHGLHPIPVEVRVQQALDKVRPYLGSHAGGVEFLGVDAEGVVHLRLQGSCDGCPSSTVTVKLAIERAIEEGAPEVTRVDVEGVTAPAKSGGLVQLQPLRGSSGSSESTRWTHVGTLDTVLPGTMAALEIGGTGVLLLSADDTLYAYRNACASCGSGLDRGSLTGTVLRCPACGAGWDAHLAGRGVDDPSRYLDPLPLLADERSVRIALPVGAFT